MAEHSLEQIKELVAHAKNLKGAHLSNALTLKDDDQADRELMLAESLAMVECHAQIALVRYLRAYGTQAS